MKEYTAIIRQTIEYQTRVFADSEDEAWDRAEDREYGDLLFADMIYEEVIDVSKA